MATKLTEVGRRPTFIMKWKSMDEVEKIRNVRKKKKKKKNLTKLKALDL